jgi:hypothetical protein
MVHSCKFIVALALAALLTAGTASLQADAFDWQTDDGNWTEAANWSPAGGPPDAGDTGTIGDGSTDITAVGDGEIGADGITVKNMATLQVAGNLGSGGFFQNITVEDGGTLEYIDNASYNAIIADMQDGRSRASRARTTAASSF